ncbi:MAG: methyltransferase domain-containing protein [Williamsia sp.]|nr:methyltransferase domain-containing protein [Williamsia sp.]
MLHQPTKPAVATPWFKSWFDSPYYHQLYGNRTDEEASHFINNLVNLLKPAAGATMLDVGCGSGRHCRQLARKRFRVTGIDLAASSIRKAQKRQTGSLQFFRHDMRLPFGKNRFDYIFNFFTSFGYFKQSHENEEVIANMAEALQPAGTLVFDYLNVAYADERLIETERKEIDGVVYNITRWTNNQFFYKKIEISDLIRGESHEYTEQVSRFTLDDFRSMLLPYNFTITRIFGDYNLEDYNTYSSPRLIIIAKRS